MGVGQLGRRQGRDHRAVIEEVQLKCFNAKTETSSAADPAIDFRHSQIMCFRSHTICAEQPISQIICDFTARKECLAASRHSYLGMAAGSPKRLWRGSLREVSSACGSKKGQISRDRGQNGFAGLFKVCELPAREHLIVFDNAGRNRRER